MGNFNGFTKPVPDGKKGTYIKGSVSSGTVNTNETIEVGDIISYYKTGIAPYNIAIEALSHGGGYTSGGTADGYVDVCQIDDNKFLSVHSNISGYCAVQVISYDSNTHVLTFNSEVIIYSGGCANLCVCKLDTNKALVGYSGTGSPNQPKLVCIPVSGTTPGFGTPVSVDSTGYYSCITYIDTDKVLLTYSGSSPSNYAKAAVVTVSGTTITINTTVTYDSNGSTSNGKHALLNSTLAVALSTVSTNYRLTSLSISGTTVSVVQTIVGYNGILDIVRIANLDQNTVLLTGKINSSNTMLLSIILVDSAGNMDNSTVTTVYEDNALTNVVELNILKTSNNTATIITYWNSPNNFCCANTVFYRKNNKYVYVRGRNIVGIFPGSAYRFCPISNIVGNYIATMLYSNTRYADVFFAKNACDGIALKSASSGQTVNFIKV